MNTEPYGVEMIACSVLRKAQLPVQQLLDVIQLCVAKLSTSKGYKLEAFVYVRARVHIRVLVCMLDVCVRGGGQYACCVCACNGRVCVVYVHICMIIISPHLLKHWLRLKGHQPCWQRRPSAMLAA